MGRTRSGGVYVAYAHDEPVCCGTLEECARALGMSVEEARWRTYASRKAEGSRTRVERVELGEEDLVRVSEDPSRLRFERRGDALYALVDGRGGGCVAYAVRGDEGTALTRVWRKEGQGPWEKIGTTRGLRAAAAVAYWDARGRGLLASADGAEYGGVPTCGNAA